MINTYVGKLAASALKLKLNQIIKTWTGNVGHIQLEDK